MGWSQGTETITRNRKRNNTETMNYIRFRFVTLLCILVHSLCSFAYDAKVNGIYYDFSGTTAIVTYYSSSSKSNAYIGSIIIPESVTYNGRTYSVTSIGDEAFWGCSGLTSVTIPSSVTSIGIYAFFNCI